jgi:hypothetical protein
MSQGDYHKARSMLNDIYQSIQGRDFGKAYTMTVRVLAELEWGTGNYSLAEEWLYELQRITITNDPNQASSDLGWAKVALSKMDWSAAAKHTASFLERQLQSPLFFHRDMYEDKYAAVYISAIISLAHKQQVRVARLLGSTDRSYQAYRLTFPLFRRQLIDQTIDDTRAALDEATFTAAWEDGKAMDLKEALAYALEVVEEIQQSG